MRLFTLLEDECHRLDLEMAELTPTVTCDGDRPSYTNFTAMIQRERELLDKKKNLEDQIKWLDQTLSLLLLTSSSSSVPVKAIENVLKEKKQKITALVRNDTNTGQIIIFFITKERELSLVGSKKKLKRKDGPFVRALDAALASFHVCRQSYYSGTFVGNHVHKTLKVLYNVRT